MMPQWRSICACIAPVVPSLLYPVAPSRSLFVLPHCSLSRRVVLLFSASQTRAVGAHAQHSMAARRQCVSSRKRTAGAAADGTDEGGAAIVAQWHDTDRSRCTDCASCASDKGSDQHSLLSTRVHALMAVCAAAGLGCWPVAVGFTVGWLCRPALSDRFGGEKRGSPGLSTHSCGMTNRLRARGWADRC